MTYLPPYLYRPDICPCHLCVENRAKLEVERVANVLNTWPKNGLIGRKAVRKTKLKAVKGARV